MNDVVQVLEALGLPPYKILEYTAQNADQEGLNQQPLSTSTTA